jgi:enoyl-CoA hydratase
MTKQTEPPEILIEFIDTVAIIRFNRPGRRNSLTIDTLIQLDSILTRIAARAGTNAIVFSGTDDVFASGADINELALLDSRAARLFAERGQKLFQRIAGAQQLTIAAINGYCMGGALDLALACSIRVASSAAMFAHPGARLGIITGWGGTQRLPRLIGRARAIDLFITARRFSATEALRIGLVTQVKDPVLNCAMEVARIAMNRRSRETSNCKFSDVTSPNPLALTLMS